jgi:hypothetical protein
MFSRPIPITTGVTVERDGFVFTDLVKTIDPEHAEPAEKT